MKNRGCTLTLPKALDFVGFPGIFKGKKAPFCLPLYGIFWLQVEKVVRIRRFAASNGEMQGYAILNHNKFRFGKDILWKDFQYYNRLV